MTATPQRKARLPSSSCRRSGRGSGCAAGWRALAVIEQRRAPPLPSPGVFFDLAPAMTSSGGSSQLGPALVSRAGSRRRGKIQAVPRGHETRNRYNERRCELALTRAHASCTPNLGEGGPAAGEAPARLVWYGLLQVCLKKSSARPTTALPGPVRRRKPPP